MDVALTIFRIGVGVGAVLVGVGIVLIALSLRPLARDARALARDARRLANLAETELTSIIGGTRQLSDGAEEVTKDLALRIEQLKDQATELEDRVDSHPAVRVAARVTTAPSQGIGPVQSPNAREDERIA